MTLADSFPSDADREDLMRRRGTQDGLGDADEFRWWAYHYGWRRVFLHAYHSAADPWFDAHAVDQAEAMFRRRITRRREWISPADQAAARGDHDTAARLRVLDRERDILAALIPAGGWETRCAEALIYVACCSRQARAGASTMTDRTAVMRGDPDALARVRDALGTSASEKAPQKRFEGPGRGERDSGGQSVGGDPGASVGLSLDDLDRRSGGLEE